jgi:hypothetical protein
MFHPPNLLTKHIILIPKSIKLNFVLLIHTKPPQQLSQQPQKWYNIFASVRHSRTEREGWATVIRPRQKFNLHSQYALDTLPPLLSKGYISPHALRDYSTDVDAWFAGVGLTPRNTCS